MIGYPHSFTNCSNMASQNGAPDNMIQRSETTEQQILKCDYSNISYCAGISCGSVLFCCTRLFF